MSDQPIEHAKPLTEEFRCTLSDEELKVLLQAYCVSGSLEDLSTAFDALVSPSDETEDDND